jgi:hypothetical protein
VKIFKRIVLWLPLFIAIFIVLVLSAGRVVQSHVSQIVVRDKLQTLLSRRVDFQGIEVSTFNILKGIRIKDLHVHEFNQKQGPFVESEDAEEQTAIFASAREVVLHVSIWKLLQGTFEIRSIDLIDLEVNARYAKNGAYNFHDLLLSPRMSYQDKLNYFKDFQNKKNKNILKKMYDQQFFKVDDLDAPLDLEFISFENGKIEIFNELNRERIVIYNLNGELSNLNIVPEMLITNNSLDVDLEFAIKKADEKLPENDQRYYIAYQIDGKIIPFDNYSRRFDPEVVLIFNSRYGTLKEYAMLKRLQELKNSQQYFEKFPFFNEELVWDDNYFKLWYKRDILKIKEGIIENSDFKLLFASTILLQSRQVKIAAELEIGDQASAYLLQEINANLNQKISNRIKDKLSEQDISNYVKDKFCNEKGNVYLKYLCQR